MRLHSGTSGYSYPEWKGHFYPAKLPTRDMLAHYASQLGTVEINNTFYRLPSPSTIKGWVSRVSEQFKFAVKAPQRITHFSKLAHTEEHLGLFCERLQEFTPKLGPVLFQTPPTLKADLELLEHFLKDWQSTSTRVLTNQPIRTAFEFRHSSWFQNEVYDLLRARNVALVGGDVDDADKNPPLISTGDHAYLRLRKMDYLPGELETWAGRIRELGCQETFVYFKHEVGGPHLAQELVRLFKAGS